MKALLSLALPLKTLPSRPCSSKLQWRSQAPLLRRQQARFKSGPYGYTQAKALVFSENGEPSSVLQLHNHSISPQLPADTVLLRTLAAPINPADINVIQGNYGSKLAFTSLLGTPEPSAIPGSEGVFEVLATSGSTSHLQKGDWVLPAAPQFGTWRTHATAKTSELLKIDKSGLTPTQAATVSVNPCTAYRILRSFGPNPGIHNGLGMRPLQVGSGEIFIQNGANSGVGRAAIQFGKLWGLRSINIIRGRESAEETQALVRELKDLGAWEVVTESQFLSRQWIDHLANLTRNGRDTIGLGLNCVGGKSATAIARSLSKGGTMVSYGAMSRQPLSLPVGLLLFKDIRFVGFWLTQWIKDDPHGRSLMINDVLGLIKTAWFHNMPVREIEWNSETSLSVLREAAQEGLKGFKKGKDVFVFRDT